MKKGNLNNSAYQRVLKRSAGITLIALIVTIIIMLILAGTSIRMLTSTGLFSNAKKATDAYQQAEEEEILQLAYADAFANSILSDETITADKFKEQLENQRN